MKNRSDKPSSTPPSYVDDMIKSVQRDPEYGYNGTIHAIRRTEYDYLGGMSFID
jgi:hypothetical protein